MLAIKGYDVSRTERTEVILQSLLFLLEEDEGDILQAL